MNDEKITFDIELDIAEQQMREDQDNSKKKFAEKALTQLGKAVQDNKVEENNPKLHSTIFMRKVKQAITKN